MFQRKGLAGLLSAVLVLALATPCYADGLSGLGAGYAIMFGLGVLQVLLLPVSIGYFFRRTEHASLRRASSLVVFLLSLLSLCISGLLFFPRASLAPFVFLAPLISFALLFHRLAARAQRTHMFSLLYGIRSVFLIVILYMCLWKVLDQLLEHFFILSLLGQHLLYFVLLVFVVAAYLKSFLVRLGHLLLLRQIIIYSVALSFAGFICCRLVLHFDYYIKGDGFVDFYDSYIWGIPFYATGAVLLALSGVGAAYIAASGKKKTAES